MRSRHLFLFPILALAAHAPAILAQSSDQPRLTGYGDIVFSFMDYGPNPKATDKGAQKDQRAVFDTKRFVLELEKKLPRNFKFEAEIEFEHGGTGAAMELEYDEGGEYETEVEKAGEVQLEELLLEHNGDYGRLRIGRIPVAFGLVPVYHKPLDYFGTVRPESEEHLIPSGWSEIGVEYMTQFAKQMVQAAIVNGFDSTGFSSQYFVRDGHQGRFEEIKGTDPALILRWTNYNIPGLETGLSFYYGDSSANRPKSDLVKACKGDSDGQKNAPCGYITTPVQMSSLFARGQWGALKSQTSLVLGRVQDASQINRRNKNLPNAYQGVLRSAVAEAAYSAWTEWGYAFNGWEDGDLLTPFVRFEHYDTVWKEAAGQVDQASYERKVLSLGAAYEIESTLYFKADILERRFGSKDLRSEHELRFALGFLY